MFADALQADGRRLNFFPVIVSQAGFHAGQNGGGAPHTHEARLLFAGLERGAEKRRHFGLEELPQEGAALFQPVPAGGIGQAQL